MTKLSENNAKNILTKLVPCWVISLVFCYMLFVYEPIMMYCTNKDGLWFDFGIMVRPVMGIFLIFFLCAVTVFTVLFFLSKRVCGIVAAAVFAVFIAFYIQGNVLTGSLPALDGSEINWGAYTADNIITLCMCLVLAAGVIIAVKKLGVGRVVMYAAGISLAVFVMLSVSLVIASVNYDLFENKNNLICTAEKFNTVSSDRNFFIFMVDSQSAEEFSQVISEREQFRHAFDDFTFFPDTLSAYAYTRDSVPFVLSGRLNKNEQEFGDYSHTALNGSPLFRELDQRNYDIYLYDSELAWYGEKDFNIRNNPSYKNVTVKFARFFEQEMRYVWFKYLPYAFKGTTDIEDLDFGKCVEMFDWRNDILYREFKNTALSKSSGAQFRFIHAEGAHVPLDMDEDMERVEHGTYLQKTTATAKLLAAFIERLKSYGVYDDSVIVIMADHGYQPVEGQPEDYILSRFNPILLIKGRNEKHDLILSDKPVSFLDLNGAYTDLLDGRKSTELFPEVKYPRTRKVIRYEIYKEEHMVEYETDGRATEWDKFRETGEVFDLP